MKNTAFLTIVLVSSLSFGQSSEAERTGLTEETTEIYSMYQCIPARIDHNKILNDVSDPFKSSDIAVVDADETGGQLEAHFAMPLRGIKPFDKAELVLNIPDIRDAESMEGIEVYYNDHLLGSCDEVKRGRVLKINVDLDPELEYGRTFSLTIKAKGEDGVYIYRWRSGWGVMLALYN